MPGRPRGAGEAGAAQGERVAARASGIDHGLPCARTPAAAYRATYTAHNLNAPLACAVRAVWRQASERPPPPNVRWMPAGRTNPTSEREESQVP